MWSWNKLSLFSIFIICIISLFFPIEQQYIIQHGGETKDCSIESMHRCILLQEITSVDEKDPVSTEDDSCCPPNDAVGNKKKEHILSSLRYIIWHLEWSMNIYRLIWQCHPGISCDCFRVRSIETIRSAQGNALLPLPWLLRAQTHIRYARSILKWAHIWIIKKYNRIHCSRCAMWHDQRTI